MSDPIIDLAEQGAEQGRELVRLEGRIDAHSARLRENQAEAIDRAGLPADLVATERNVWWRIGPFRDRWEDVDKFNVQAAELEMRQAEIGREMQELVQDRLDAPTADSGRLAAWQLAGEKGPRPEPTLPGIEDRIAARQADYEALSVAIGQVLRDKAEYVQKHRSRLIRDADADLDAEHQEGLELIDRYAAWRERMRDKRRNAVWARLYPHEQLAREVPDTFAGGLPKHLRPMGLKAEVAPGRVIDAMRADADCLRTAATPEQKALIGEGRDPRTPPATVWDRSEEGQQWERDERQRALQRLNDPRWDPEPPRPKDPS